jgi:predicted alpha-1,2-mannosidase
MKALIEKCGGKEVFTRRLDTYFTHEHWNQRWFMGLFQVSNEPGFLTPCLYNYVGRPDRTAEIVRHILKERYNTTREGIPGNDDSGSMSSWYVFHSLGFYPNAGQNLYLISSPVFEEVTIHLENGKTLQIKAKNAGAKNIYIQSAKWNGVPFDENYLRHTDIADGGVLEFVMGAKPSQWGRMVKLKQFF